MLQRSLSVLGVLLFLSPSLKGLQASTPSPQEVMQRKPAALGTSCHSDDPESICLGIKYVVYKAPDGKSLLTEDDVVQNVQEINKLWKQCKISFQVDQFQPVVPDEAKLKLQTANISELDDIRNAYGDSDSLLVVTTGRWDRRGTLGKSKANAWTSMPDGAPYGIVIERPVGTFPGLLAHELGHYLNLYHKSDARELMDPVIYQNSTVIPPAQCQTARAAAGSFWQKMMR